jgi:hypothetical protein
MTSVHPTTLRDAGLTLLEVLAAAMIFAMVMTVLIGTSSTAVHHIGTSARRLEANLVADEILADLEIRMNRGQAPEVEDLETEREQFTIQTTRSDLSLDSGNSLGSEGGGSVTAMLGAELPEVAKHLKQYDIEVSWFEQTGAQSVTRTTFAFDWELAAIEYSDLFARAENGIDGGLSGGGGLDDVSGLSPERRALRESRGSPTANGGGTRTNLVEWGKATEADKEAFRARTRRGPRRDGHNARNNLLIRSRESQ